jgi:hypothetical protein
LNEPNFSFKRRDVTDEDAAFIADETSSDLKLKQPRISEFVSEIRSIGFSPGEFR